MDEPTQSVNCGACGAALNSDGRLPSGDKIPCPNCGSTVRAFHITLETIAVRARIKMGFKHKDPFGKVLTEGVGGDDLFRKLGKWMQLDRFFDHINDRYRETITDPETGVIVHHCEEPLSKHRGHGDDKRHADTGHS
jgi:DNA-directed RNA polymerase subunit RPC12/RpoP